LVKLAPEYTGLTSSSNGKRMVGWTKTAVARLLDVNGQPVATLEGHTGPIRTATFSPDDQFILTCSRDHTARLWDAQGRFVAALTGHSGHVYSGSFSPDGHLILTRASDGSARLWNIDGHQIAVLQEKNEFLTEAQFDYTGKAVITLSADGISRAWSLDGKLIGLIQPASGPVKTVKAIGANAIAVITGNQDLSVYTLDGKITFSIKHPSIVAGMNSHSDGSLLITWSKDYVVRLWDRDGQLLREFKGHRANIMDASLSEDKKLLLTTSKDGTARLWNREGDLLTEWTIGPDKPLPPRFIAGGHKIVSVANGRQSTLTSSLLPADVYQKMDAATLLQSPVIRQLVQTYNIQFYESFLGH
jgi:WD40 repeat protein